MKQRKQLQLRLMQHALHHPAASTRHTINPHQQLSQEQQLQQQPQQPERHCQQLQQQHRRHSTQMMPP